MFDKRCNKFSGRQLCIVMVLSAFAMSGCGSDYQGGLRTGPTITPAPSIATESEADTYSLNMSDEEIEEVLVGVKERALEQEVSYNFEITDDMTAEKSEHDDGSSEVFVYDSDDNMLAILVYQDRALTRADIDNYENGVAVSGCIYEDDILTTYYETAELNGSFRVEVHFRDGEPYEYEVTTGYNETKIFN